MRPPSSVSVASSVVAPAPPPMPSIDRWGPLRTLRDLDPAGVGAKPKQAKPKQAKSKQVKHIIAAATTTATTIIPFTFKILCFLGDWNSQ